MEEEKLLDIVNTGSTTHAAGNGTDVIGAETEEIETLTIIVWCVGGLLLISLLSLLGRIILAKKKVSNSFEQFDYFENITTTPRTNRHFRIRIDGSPLDTGFTPSPSRDTVGLVLGSDAPVTDTPVLSRILNEHTQHVNHGNPNITSHMPSSSSSSIPHDIESNRESNRESNQIQTRQLPCGQYMTIPPPRTAQLLQTDENGSRAAINGYIIRPPPYREVINPCNRIPNVVVTRDQNQVIQARRQLFSL